MSQLVTNINSSNNSSDAHRQQNEHPLVQKALSDFTSHENSEYAASPIGRVFNGKNKPKGASDPLVVQMAQPNNILMMQTLQSTGEKMDQETNIDFSKEDGMKHKLH